MSLYNKIKLDIPDQDKLLIELVCNYIENNKCNIDIYNELKSIYNNISFINDIITIINAIKKKSSYNNKHAEYIKLIITNMK
jgi:hypothetical protein